MGGDDMGDGGGMKRKASSDGVWSPSTPIMMGVGILPKALLRAVNAALAAPARLRGSRRGACLGAGAPPRAPPPPR